MGRSRLVSILLGAALVLVFAAPAGAKTDEFTQQIIGPGAFAVWTTAPGDLEDGDYIDTMLFASGELNAPGAGTPLENRTPSEGLTFMQVFYHLEDGEAVWDSWTEADLFAPPFGEATVAFQQPLRSASASASGDLLACSAETGECSPAGTITVDVSWTGSGPITRDHVLPDMIVTPGESVSLWIGGPIDVFVRAVGTVEISHLDGATLPAGSQLIGDPFGSSPAGFHGSRLFRVHAGGATICHNGTVDPDTGECIPLGG